MVRRQVDHQAGGVDGLLQLATPDFELLRAHLTGEDRCRRGAADSEASPQRALDVHARRKGHAEARGEFGKLCDGCIDRIQLECEPVSLHRAR